MNDHAEEFARTWAAVRPSLLKFAGELSEPLTPADAGRMFLAAAAMCMGSCMTPQQIADELRAMAAIIDRPRVSH